MADAIKCAEDIDAADKVELRVPDLETGDVHRYQSMVQDVTDEGISVSMPTEGHVTVPLPEGTAVVVSIWKGHADHRFKSRVLSREGGRIPRLLLSKPRPERITRAPRRQHYRVEAKIAARARVVDSEDKKFRQGTLRDLSVKGCRLQAQERIPAESRVSLDFDLPFPPDEEGHDRTKPLRQIPGQIRWVSEPQGIARTGTRSVLHGIEFEELHNVKQAVLLRYVALRQRELIRQMKDGQPLSQEEAPKPITPDLEEAEEILKHTVEQIKEAGGEPQEGQETPVDADEEGPGPEVAAAGAPTDGIDEAAPARALNGPEVQPAVPPEEAPLEEGGPVPDGPEEAERTDEASPPILMPTTKANGKTVLVVDDEEGIREIIAEVLLHEGFRVLAAANGREALGIATSIGVDLVVTDLMMPEMNGWRLLARLRELQLNVPVVLITGYMNREGQEVLTSRDIAGFLTKPVKIDEIVKMANRILFPETMGRRHRILAADDEEDMRLLISASLESAGFEVETAADGEEALEKVSQMRPDLVLLDIMMPKMNGFEVCRHLRSRSLTAEIPIILLTVKTSPEYVQQALAFSVDAYMVKPFDPGDLVARIRRALQKTGVGA